MSSLRRSHVLAARLLVTVGISGGAGAAIFVLAASLLLPSVPFPRPANLFVISGVVIPWAQEHAVWLQEVAHVESASAVTAGRVEAHAMQRTERLVALEVSQSFLDVLDVSPVIGRPFTMADLSERQNVAMISEELWDRWWRGASDLRTDATIERLPFAIVGVFPNSVRVFGQPDILLLRLPLRRLVDRSLGDELPLVEGTVVRLRTPTEQQSVAVALRARQPKNLDIDVAPLSSALVATTGLSALIAVIALGVLVAGGAVNAIALCVTGLHETRPELAVRSALGATYRRLFVDHASRVGALLVAAAAASYWLAVVLLGTISSVLPALAGILEHGGHAKSMALFVAGFVGGVYVAVLFISSRSIRRGCCGTSGMLQLRVGAARTATRGVVTYILGLQVAATVVLATGAIHTGLEYWRRTREHLGFVPSRLWTFQVYDGASPPDGPRSENLARRIATETSSVLSMLDALPGVTSSGAVSDLPLAKGFAYLLYVEAVGQRTRGTMHVISVAGDFGGALGVTLLKGRLTSAADDVHSADSVVIDRRAAETLFPTRDALGEMVRVAGTPARRVIGIVDRVAMLGSGKTARGQVYVLNSNAVQSPMRLHYLVRLAGEDRYFGQTLERAIRGFAPSLTALRVRTGDELATAPFAWVRTAGAVLILFGIALGVLAGIGLLGVISDTLQRQHHSVAIKLALGASFSRLQRDIARRLYLTMAGAAAVGGYASWLLLRWVSTQVEISRPSILVTGATAGVVLMVALFLAAWHIQRLVRRVSFDRLAQS